ncbi:nucleoside diphosphate kinase regulator [Oceanibacterium hippocampi]|uniref:Regulator of nucleoside diphosphate kinase n=1 Tax=Oceanibacterium hippocampi TaxID=745714 RepID=A0A1Y5SUZ0_9PROT|nr:nucleoside diphosphate kinase regulator [Oceanibacterium hippocampi]SLN49131.1 Regulator of nucleoside diphosphate kinase [Oceanibacterium hippocampi]
MSTRHSETTLGSDAIIVTDRDHERLFGLANRYDQLNEVSRMLAQELENAKVVDATEIPATVVTMNSQVTVREEDTGKVRTYTLVYPGEADISAGKLSILTPVGTALIGLSEGETMEWTTRDGRSKELTVVKVVYQPEADGRFDL